MGTFLCWSAFFQALLAQQSSSELVDIGFSAPAPPRSRILDDAGLLEFREEVRDRISARLKKVEADHGVSVYLAIYSSIFDGDIRQRADDLHRAWLGEDSEGIVVACETDTGFIKVAFPSEGVKMTLQGEQPVTRIPTYRQEQILNKVAQATSNAHGKVDFLDLLTESLVAELDATLSGEKERSSTTKFVVVTLLSGCLLGVLGYVGSRYARRIERKSGEQLFFPDVEVGSRLGAPYSGGRVNVLSFKETGGAGEESS